MRGVTKKSFVKAIKSKVIVALVLACFALLTAWTLSRLAFDEMLRTVDNITAPSERLRMVNVISRRIGTLDQLQREQVFSNPERYRRGLRESREVREALDSLLFLYIGDSIQSSRILAIKSLLNERDKQFLAYLKVRAGLVNNKPFSDQVRRIGDLVSKKNAGLDSTVLATEEKTSTTTIYPTEEKSRSFFGKIFGKRKSKEEQSIKIVNEEKVRVDTIALSEESQAIRNLESSLAHIESEQRRKSAVFLNKEAELTTINRRLIRKMFSVLREVESEVVGQLELTGGRARLAISSGINVIGLVIIFFVLLMALLLYFILTDITNSGKYRAELEDAKDEAEYHGRAKQRFLSNMSHEIRTPLQSIIGYSDLMKSGAVPEKKYVDAISQSSEHLLQIVNEVLDYNRIVSGKFTFSNSAFDVGAVMQEVVSAMRPEAELKGLELVLEFDFANLNFVYGDPFRLKQILYNLIGNAIKFTAYGSVMVMSSYRKKGSDLHFTFVVKDTGPGISEAESGRIFNEFEQGNLRTEMGLESSGTGLGLSIIKSLIEQQGGRIYLKSKLGEGSVFSFYLVFGESAALTPDRSPVSIDNSCFGKCWVVDDDAMILDLFRIIFERNGIEHRIFQSSSDLLAAEWDEQVKYMLMDIRMPGIDGVNLCRIIKERGKADVKILAITAQVLPDERDLLLASGFDGLIMKPFRESDILESITLAQMNVTERKQDFEVDLAPLKAMTFGDEEQMKKILSRFHKDCEADSAEVRMAIQLSNVELVLLLVHRVGGRLAQVGFKDLAQEFKACELELRKSTILTEAIAKRISELFDKLSLARQSIS